MRIRSCFCATAYTALRRSVPCVAPVGLCPELIFFFFFHVNRLSHRDKCNLRHKVNQKWFAGPSTLLIPIGENFVQVLWDQSLLIKFHWAHHYSHWQSSLDSTGECKLLCDKVITTLKEHSEHNLQGGCATDRGNTLPILIRWIMVNLATISQQLYINSNKSSLYKDYMPQCAQLSI